MRGNDISDDEIYKLCSNNSKSYSQRDLRPRWVNLNRIYYSNFSSSENAIDTMSCDTDDSYTIGNHSTNKRHFPKSRWNVIRGEFETPL